jgi:hypothetical protein
LHAARTSESRRTAPEGRRRLSGRLLRILFPLVLVVLITSNVLSFAAYLGGKAPVSRSPGGGDSPYVLRLRSPGEEPRHRSFAGWARLEAALGGTTLILASGVEVDPWPWRNLARVELRRGDRMVTAPAKKLRGAAVERIETPSHRVFLLGTGEVLRRGPVLLLGDPETGDLFLVPRSRMKGLGGATP